MRVMQLTKISIESKLIELILILADIIIIIFLSTFLQKEDMRK